MNNDSFWNFYWETRLQHLQGQGKGEVILQSSRLIRAANQPIRILEAGCGEAQIIGSLVDAHGSPEGEQASVGIDRDLTALAVARKTYPSIRFLTGDFTDTELLQSLGKFDLLLLVNALHHVFSDAYDPSIGEIDVPKGKANLHTSFATLAQSVKPGGYVILFDGLEADIPLDTPVQIQFQSPEAQGKFQTFAREYLPFRIQYQLNTGDSVTLSMRNFTRYVTKIIFLGKPLWKRERQESYQYFNESEMHTMLTRNGFDIQEFRLLSVDYDHWLQEVRILTPGVDFPPEHVLITAQKTG
ncbi:MAG: methyltransferase domain-containing protein [Anaerolineaceae bacterium]|nr:methyltransferase domain-containing protein [Anaerolineaceae bacterium]